MEMLAIRSQEVHGDITLGKGLRRMTYTPEDCGNLISQYRLLGCSVLQNCEEPRRAKGERREQKIKIDT